MHISKGGNRLACGRVAKKKDMVEQNMEDLNNGNTCNVCLAFFNSSLVVRYSNVDGRIGEIVKCPYDITDFGWVKIVAEQKEPGNLMQPGTEAWDYIVTEYDPDSPNEIRPHFRVSRKELKQWEEIL